MVSIRAEKPVENGTASEFERWSDVILCANGDGSGCRKDLTQTNERLPILDDFRTLSVAFAKHPVVI